MGKFINPFSDWGFKLIFGQEITKDLLISFLNDLLKGEHTITDITFKDKEQLPEAKNMRGIIYDIYCTTDQGQHIIVEMQNRYQKTFCRSLSLLCFACYSKARREGGMGLSPRAGLYCMFYELQYRE